LELIALNNYVTAEIDPVVETVTGRHGLVIPRRETPFRVTGTVISVGPTCRIPELRPGVRILFPPFGAGHRSRVNGREVISLLDWEILGWFFDDAGAGAAGGGPVGGGGGERDASGDEPPAGEARAGEVSGAVAEAGRVRPGGGEGDAAAAGPDQPAIVRDIGSGEVDP
jgi:hypothetical protein